MMDNNIDIEKLKNEERIEKYLFSKMSAEEENQFETDLKNDEVLRMQAESAAQMVRAMKIVGGQKDRKIMSEMKQRRLSVKSLTRVRYSVAACIVAVLMIGGGWFYYDYNRITGLGREYVINFPEGSLVRGDSDNETENELRELFEKVAKAEDLSSTITQLTRLWQVSRGDTYNEYTTYAPYIGWNLALAHLQNNDKKKARIVLDDLENECPQGTAMGDKVRELKKKL